MNNYCDIVMKGGITSGVVYPLAAVRLAERYRFKNVGGTSAGAIAAAAVAAAEHGRSREAGTSFGELEELPAWLGQNMTSVFQPSSTTKPLFKIVLAATRGSSAAGKGLRAAGAALGSFPLAALLGALPGIVLGVTAAFSASGFMLVWSLACALVLLAGGVAVALTITLARCVAITVPENGFGVISGGRGEGEPGAEPLTEWLANLLDRLAGQEGPGALTFGDLWGSSDPNAEREVNLQMMTTCLTQGRPYRLPFAGSQFWFDPEEMRGLFPDRVVEQMIDDGRKVKRTRDFGRLVPLPEAANLPVVVAVRMSLSFPFLISAVPLHAIDYSRPVPEAKREPERCWFSDGGITSNFPVHFFDGPVPRWPTFAIDLRKLPGEWTPSENQCENVWMAPSNDSRGDAWWVGWEELPPHRRLVAFAGSIFRTMQNWVDQTQSQVHGYRDRVVHIEHSGAEGGMNLTMPTEVIRDLSERGGCAGKLLVSRFAGLPDGEIPLDAAGEPLAGWKDSPLDWPNQRWIRYRSFLALLEDALVRLRTGCVEGEPAIEEMSRRALDAPPDFGWLTEEQREFALAATARLNGLPEHWKESGESFEPGVPEPAPSLRVGPRT